MRWSIFLLAFLMPGASTAAPGLRCEDPTAQAEIAARARDSGVPQQLFTMQMPPLVATSSGPTKQGHAILRDAYALADLSQ